MTKIVAKGDNLTVEIKKTNRAITILFNGKQNKFLLERLHCSALNAPAMGGTFYPREGTMLSYFNALENGRFFLNLDRIDVEGDIGEIPNKNERIY